MRWTLPILICAALGACAEITHRGIDIPRTEVLTVSEAQRFLLVAGYEPGRVDGIMGPRTAGALNAFAAAEGLPGGGAITPELSHRLEEAALHGDGGAGLGDALSALAEADFARIPRAQRTLATAGYNPGPADGIIGPRTRAALRAFQRDSGLPVTGELDAATAARLNALAAR